MEIAITVVQIILLSLALSIGLFHAFISNIINSTSWTTRLLFCPLSRYLFRPALINYLERSLLDGNYDLCFPSDSLVIIKLYGSNEEFCFGLGLEKIEETGKSKPEGNYSFSCFVPNSLWKTCPKTLDGDIEEINDLGELMGDANLKLLSNIIFAYHIEDIVSKLKSDKGEKINVVNPW